MGARRRRALLVGMKDTAAGERLAEQLRRVPGVLEAVVVPAEGVAYLRAGTGSMRCCWRVHPSSASNLEAQLWD